MAGITIKTLKNLKNGEVEVEYVDASGQTQKAKCHDPLTCREHANIFAGSNHPAMSRAALSELEDKNDADNAGVSVKDYEISERKEALYYTHTMDIPTNDMSRENPYTVKPKDGKVVCTKCNEELELRTMKWENESYNGRDRVWIHKNKPENDFFQNPSLNKNLEIQGTGTFSNTPVEPAHYENHEPWCPKCGTVGSLKLTMEPYYDRNDCTNPECNYESSYAIGD
jgi:hypothetical protein